MAKKKVTISRRKSIKRSIKIPLHIFWLGIGTVILSCIAVALSYSNNTQSLKNSTLPLQHNVIPTVSLQTLTNENMGISFSYYSSMQVIKNDPQIIELGLNNDKFSYITITSNLTDVENLPECKNDNLDSETNPCASRVEDIKISGITATKYIYQCGNDCGWIFFQIYGQKPFEIKEYVSGAGLEKFSSEIVSTLHITQE